MKIKTKPYPIPKRAKNPPPLEDCEKFVVRDDFCFSKILLIIALILGISLGYLIK